MYLAQFSASSPHIHNWTLFCDLPLCDILQFSDNFQEMTSAKTFPQIFHWKLSCQKSWEFPVFFFNFLRASYLAVMCERGRDERLRDYSKKFFRYDHEYWVLDAIIQIHRYHFWSLSNEFCSCWSRKFLAFFFLRVQGRVTYDALALKLRTTQPH